MPLPAPVPVDFERVLRLWCLTPEGEPIITPSSHLLPVRWMGRAAMLKRALDVEEQGGCRVMSWWCGEGAAQVFAYDGDSILMERAEGTRSLMHMALNGEDDQASRILCDVVRRLHWPRDEPPADLVERLLRLGLESDVVDRAAAEHRRVVGGVVGELEHVELRVRADGHEREAAGGLTVLGVGVLVGEDGGAEHLAVERVEALGVLGEHGHVVDP